MGSAMLLLIKRRTTPSRLPPASISPPDMSTNNEVKRPTQDAPNLGPLRGIGPAIRILRLRRGVSQSQLAALCEITPPMISNYERNANVPSLKTLGKLLEALDADLLELKDALSVVQGSNTLPIATPRSAQLESYLLHQLHLAEAHPCRRSFMLQALVAVTHAFMESKDLAAEKR